MKIVSFKSNIRRILPVIMFLTVAGVSAQGLYSHNKTASENETGTTGNSNNSSDGRLFRAGSTENEADSGLANKISPLKDGWEILLIAGIGYGFCIRRKKN
jgi:hypothetical protein